MQRLLARWWPPQPARRLRVIGGVVLVLGLSGACLFYWAHRSSTPTLDELMPGYSQGRARQTAILMGSFVVTLLGWADELKKPSSQALIMAGVSALVAWICFHVASLLDRAPDDESGALRRKDG